MYLSHYQDDVSGDERIWTLDDPKEEAALFRKGVAGIFTDDFVTMTALRDELTVN